MPLVTLVGYRGSGKSAVAAALAARLGCSWQDADDLLEQEAGESIAALIARCGEPAFRAAEAALLPRLLAGEEGILATGGGVVLRAENRRLLRERGRPVVWLVAPAEVLRSRLAADPATAGRRPALGGGDVLAEVAAAVAHRKPFYREVADGLLDVSADSPHRLAARLAAWRAGWSPPARADREPAGESIP